MIRVDSAFVANAAHLEANGLVSVLGAWVDGIAGPQLPVRQQLWFVARLTLESLDAETAHTFTLLVEHSDGSEEVARIETGAPPIPRSALDQLDPDLPIAVPMVLLMPLEFRRVGLYYFRLRIDGDLAWSSPLKVRTALPQM